MSERSEAQKRADQNYEATPKAIARRKKYLDAHKEVISARRKVAYRQRTPEQIELDKERQRRNYLRRRALKNPQEND